MMRGSQQILLGVARSFTARTRIESPNNAMNGGLKCLIASTPEMPYSNATKVMGILGRPLLQAKLHGCSDGENIVLRKERN
jgi:hypothetical protein